MRIAALSSTAAILLGCAVVTAGPVGHVNAGQGCQVFQVRSPWPGADSRFLRVDLVSGATTAIGTLHREVNAIGYVADQGLVYGIADNGDVVSVDGAGQDTDLGPPWTGRGHPERLWDANAGTVIGDDLYVESGTTLYTVDTAPGPDRLRVTAWTDLWPDWLADTIDDFDIDRATGAVYGVADVSPWRAAVVSINPASGEVARAGPPDLPAGEYGSVTVGPDRTLYAMIDELHGRAVLFRIPLAGGAPTSTDAGPAVTGSDATGCLPAVIPPPPPSTTQPPPPPPTKPSPPPPATTHPAPVPLPMKTPPPPTTTPNKTPPSSALQLAPPLSAPTTTPGRPPVGSPPAQPKNAAAEVARQRRWGLTLLVLIIGGAAVGSRVRARRR